MLIRKSVINSMKFEIAGIDHYKESFVEKYTEKRLLDYANSVMRGKLTVGYRSLTPLMYDPERLHQFDWDLRRVSVTNSYCLYLFGLRFVYILAKASLVEEEFSYLEFAERFIRSIHTYIFSLDSDQKHPFLYNDHAICERIENIVFWGYAASRLDYPLPDVSILRDLIQNDTYRLADDASLYQKRHNHGIIADKAQLTGAYALQDERTDELINLAVSRLEAQIAFGFDRNTIHVENSIDYHIAVTNILMGVKNSLEFINHPYSRELDELIEQSHEYIAYAIKPNIKRPLFGDSKGTQHRGPGTLESADNSHLEYIASQGQDGACPDDLVKHFYGSGYAFVREHFRPEDFDQSTWISLKAGYVTRTHKHQDDLSVCLYSKGYDIFVDPGMYNYVHGDPIRNYIESVSAHTALDVDSRGYSIASGNGEKFRIQQASHFDHYDYLMASSRVFPDVAIYRHVYFFRILNIVIIRDEFISDREHSYSQFFHLGDDIIVDKKNPQRIVLTIGDSGFSAVIRQLLPVKSLSVLNGMKTRPFSLMSQGFDRYIETQSLHYTQQTKSCEFITVVEIKSSLQAQEPCFDQVSLRENIVNCGPYRLNFQETHPVTFNGVDLMMDGLKLEVKNHKSNNPAEKYALYLIDHDTTQYLAKLPYTSDEIINFEFDHPRNVDLMYYVNNGSGEIVKGIIGCLRVQDDKMIVSKTYENLHQPIVGELMVKKKRKSNYQFTIPVDFDFNYRIQWWVYFNGASIPVGEVKGDQMQVRLKESGSYVIMYSLRNPYFGEFGFGQSQKIPID